MAMGAALLAGGSRLRTLDLDVDAYKTSDSGEQTGEEHEEDEEGAGSPSSFPPAAHGWCALLAPVLGTQAGGAGGGDDDKAVLLPNLRRLRLGVGGCVRRVCACVWF